MSRICPGCDHPIDGEANHDWCENEEKTKTDPRGRVRTITSPLHTWLDQLNRKLDAEAESKEDERE